MKYDFPLGWITEQRLFAQAAQFHVPKVMIVGLRMSALWAHRLQRNFMCGAPLNRWDCPKKTVVKLAFALRIVSHAGGAPGTPPTNKGMAILRYSWSE